MIINLLTIFPAYFDSVLAQSMLKRSQQSGLITFRVINLRDYALDKHQTTDDRPFGGGPGMVMKVEPIYLALQALAKTAAPQSHTILTSAKGKLFTQSLAKSYAQLDELNIICGHYEGVDERVAQHLVDEEIRIGDYVLTGGEPAAAVILDAVTRLIPGVLGNEKSNQDESHSQPGQLGFPQYTRPEKFNNWSVPAPLLSGDHAQIQRWRDEQKQK